MDTSDTSSSPQPQRSGNLVVTRVLLALLTLTSTAGAVWLFYRVITADGLGLFDVPLLGLFSVLFVWVAFSFWTATLGFVVVLWKKRHNTKPTETPTAVADLPRTAILMPIYNESTTDVFANLRALFLSLLHAQADSAFEIFVLSDTTNPDIWLEEERAWAQMVSDLPNARVFYRHRPQNTSRKAGNIADFCNRWGDRYKYMIVLDADSVMAGATLVEMVRRMEADPEIGILQVPPTPVNRQSFFARMQQFAAHVYGPVFIEGFALWSQRDGNYWGHNAIIRIAPFMEHCDLPILPGDGPMGGEILSHDFVEAALMRRAGWRVCLAHDLSGSYEECPTTMLDFAQRDQRWCQGNMQHIKLLLAEGFHPASRLHLGMGAMSYLASPLWLTFLLLSVAAAIFGGNPVEEAPSGILLFALTMGMLLLPKVFGVLTLPRKTEFDRRVWGRALGGMLIETAASVLIAPVMMLLHTQFVVSTALGTKVKWNAQQRDDRGVSLGDAVAVHYPHTLAGVIATALVAWAAPGLLLWLSPVLLGLLLSIPMSMLLGSLRVGKWLARRRLLVIPEEVRLPAVLRWQRQALALANSRRTAADQKDPFAAVLNDPAFYALHVGIIQATQPDQPVSPDERRTATRLVKTRGSRAVPGDLRRAILNDRRAIEYLHILTRSQGRGSESVLLA